MKLTLIFVAGCAYHGGAFSDVHGSFDGQRLTLGCVDLAIAKDLTGDQPIVSYAFGNSCHHPVTLDFTAIHVRGRSADGAMHELVAFDPRHEIRPLAIDALISGHENISYLAEQPILDVQIDVSGMVPR